MRQKRESGPPAPNLCGIPFGSLYTMKMKIHVAALLHTFMRQKRESDPPAPNLFGISSESLESISALSESLWNRFRLSVNLSGITWIYLETIESLWNNFWPSLNLQWVTRVESLWNHFWLSLNHFWLCLNLLGIYLGSLWNLYESLVDTRWNLFGITLGPRWITPGSLCISCGTVVAWGNCTCCAGVCVCLRVFRSSQNIDMRRRNKQQEVWVCLSVCVCDRPTIGEPQNLSEKIGFEFSTPINSKPEKIKNPCLWYTNHRWAPKPIRKDRFWVLHTDKFQARENQESMSVVDPIGEPQNLSERIGFESSTPINSKPEKIKNPCLW